MLFFVCFNRRGEFGFFIDFRRFNVLFMRVKRKLIVVGDFLMFLNYLIYRRFIEFVRERGMFIEIDGKKY